MEKCLYLVFILLSFYSCGNEEDSESDITIGTSDYVAFAWNDLGMHCLNPTYDTAVILPPYNNLNVQVVRRGNPPTIVTSGITAEYRIINNTYSDGKTYSGTGADYGQFWDNVLPLFGATLTPDTGLNLVEASLHNGLSGDMVVRDNDHFAAEGIPVTPVDDDGTWDPYQIAEVTIKDGSGNTIAQTRATIPTSDEINCSNCHSGSTTTAVFNDVLADHDSAHSTTLSSSKPVLCASCHGSPALGSADGGTNGYLSYAIHNAHKTRGATCYDCHPGASTKCNRSLAHTATDGDCTTCHGTMTEIADQINSGAKKPWVDEPKCVTCHTNVAGVDTGNTLYRNATGHGGMNCTACHGSPHAMVPSREASDNYQALQYQNKSKTIASCAACHSDSRGEGFSEFEDEHNEHNSACNVCHTKITSAGTQSKWPHSFQWKAH